MREPLLLVATSDFARGMALARSSRAFLIAFKRFAN